MNKKLIFLHRLKMLLYIFGLFFLCVAAFVFNEIAGFVAVGLAMLLTAIIIEKDLRGVG